MSDGPLGVDTSERTLPRLDAGVTAAFVAAATGVATGTPVLLLVAVAGIAYTAYGALTELPAVDLELERALSDATPVPGDDVTVTVTVRNVGENTLPDVRVFDGVPDELPVTGGSPRHATALRPGEETTFEYDLSARRGDYAFSSATVFARDVSGVSERVEYVGPSEETELRCRTAIDEMPVTRNTVHYTGRVTTDSGGTGVEFHSTRQYRPGDPMNRVDWNRLARTGDLTTIDYREERSVTVVVVVDARTSAVVAPRADAPDAVDLNAYAAERASLALLGNGNRVGVSVFGAGGQWLAPGAGDAHERRTRATIQTAAEQASDGRTLRRGVTDGGPAGSAAFRGTDRVTQLRERMPANAQVLLVSAATDSFPADLAQSLRAHGHGVTLLSPDVTSRDTLGGRVASLDRRGNLDDVRGTATRVVNWSPDEPIDLAVARALERWF